MKEQRYKIFLPFILALVLALGMLLGSKMSESKPIFTAVGRKSYGKFEKLLQILDYVDHKYVDSVDIDHLVEASISGLLAELDPHSVYISPEEYRQTAELLQGNFEGIGIEFSIMDDTITVVSPISGGPSAELGIMAGDRIVEIEGEQVAGVGISNKDVVERLRGKKGTKVKIAVKRAGNLDRIDYTITRDKIPVYSIDVGYMVDDNTGYIKITRFSETTYKEFVQKLKALKSQGMENLIIDLRNNAGGVLREVVLITDELLSDDKMIVYTQGRTQPRREYRSERKGLFEEGKLTVIIDEGSASASEILAGAVQDWDRGVIVGRRSFGKGLVQEPFSFEDTSSMRLTIARFYTPSGRCIQKPYEKGLEEYYRESYDRYSNGELKNEDSIKVNDSLKYETPTGKIVYGGGGIIPDIFVPIDYSGGSPYLNSLFSNDILRRFAYHYLANRKASFEKYKNYSAFTNEYQVSDRLLKEFTKYAEENGVEYIESDFRKSRELISIYVKAFIGQRLFDNEGFRSVINKSDKTFLKAYETVTDPGI